jgi:hypothetical protein
LWADFPPKTEIYPFLTEENIREHCVSLSWNTFGETSMEKSTKKQLSLICFLIGFTLVLLQDLKGFATIDPGFSWPWAVMFYSGLLLMLIGYYLRG